MAGQKVPAYAGSPTQPWQHVSFFPDAEVHYRTATVTEILWTIPMRLYVPYVDIADLRRRLPVLYPAYITAFAKHLQLLGTTSSGAVARLVFQLQNDDKYAWLEIRLPLWERLNLENVA